MTEQNGAAIQISWQATHDPDGKPWVTRTETMGILSQSIALPADRVEDYLAENAKQAREAANQAIRAAKKTNSGLTIVNHPLPRSRA